MHRVNPVTYTLFEHTSSDGLSGSQDFPRVDKKKNFFWKPRSTQVGRCDTNLIHFVLNVLAILLKKNKNLDRQSGRGVFCNDTSCFIYLFLLGTRKSLHSHVAPSCILQQLIAVCTFLFKRVKTWFTFKKGCMYCENAISLKVQRQWTLSLHDHFYIFEYIDKILRYGSFVCVHALHKKSKLNYQDF